MQLAKQNYFQLFDLSESYGLDLDKLTAEYHRLQLEYHPDKQSGASEEDRVAAQLAASYINDAYETLKSPLKRAAYVLTTKGKDAESVDQSDLSMEVLVEQMELRESLDELPRDETALPKLEDLKSVVQGKIKNKQKKFEDWVAIDDLDSAKKTFHELQFLFKLLSEIEEGEEIRLGY